MLRSPRRRSPVPGGEAVLPGAAEDGAGLVAAGALLVTRAACRAPVPASARPRLGRSSGMAGISTGAGHRGRRGPYRSPARAAGSAARSTSLPLGGPARTSTSTWTTASLLARGRVVAPAGARRAGLAVGEDDQQHRQQDPADRHADGDLGEDVARLGPEGARAAHAAEGAGQAASLAALDQDEADQEERVRIDQRRSKCR